MIKCPEFLPNHLAEELVKETLQAKLLVTNQLLIGTAHSVELIRQRVGSVLGQDVVFFKAFLFLLTETTYEGVRVDDGEGWHNDASCNDVNGECINVWIPLYCSGQSSGVRVATRRDNEWLYSALPQAGARLDVLTKARRPDLFEGDGSDDLLVIDAANGAGISLKVSDLILQTAVGLSVGDAVIFSQRDLHQGIHGDGVRIQLTLKFVVDSNAAIAEETASSTSIKPTLSKHGVLERQLMRELLGLQAVHLRESGRVLPAPISFHEA
ncbi:hypothetical protein [Stenotrophomonas sp. CFBP8980]|uniref:hypothetical protein n=1 Tax=Stenotrophomonas sp. CFBP8980 TaxID=3096523 RepID=UPI002A6A5F3B|nr:hypothetical protein [Stenotrophomonas sp. CFBP8980]MDY1034228.1 hypothetical protein [Stenotrophomonas sp. CFBP8980]